MTDGTAPRSALAELTSEALGHRLDGGAPLVALVPVGSVEPHGPHLPLATDTLIGEVVAQGALAPLAGKGIGALVAPSVPYGVTDFAAGFPGAVSLPAPALTAFLRAVVEGLLHAGFLHVCLVSNHLEPAHDAAVRASLEALPEGAASVASPLARRWGRTLSPEYKSGACHAGRYETSLVLAARADLVDMDRASRLPPLDISLSDGIRKGQASFLAMGLDAAYTGAPAEASLEEGRDLVGRLVAMVVSEVEEGVARALARRERDEQVARDAMG